MIFQVLWFSKPFSLTTFMKLLRKTFFLCKPVLLVVKHLTATKFNENTWTRCTYVRSGNAEATVRIVAAL